MPHDDQSQAAMRLGILHRIADALAVPENVLHEPAPVIQGGAGSPPLSEVAAVLTAFLQIRDPEQRRACLDHVVAVANDRERPTGG